MSDPTTPSPYGDLVDPTGADPMNDIPASGQDDPFVEQPGARWMVLTARVYADPYTSNLRDIAEGIGRIFGIGTLVDGVTLALAPSFRGPPYPAPATP